MCGGSSFGGPNSDYKLGSNAPSVTFDAGAGVHGSEDPTWEMEALKTALLAKPMSITSPNALAHLQHYLKNTGSDYNIDFQDVLDKVPDEQRLFETELSAAKTFVESLQEGHYSVVREQAVGGYVYKSENWDWFFATAGYSAWIKCDATVNCLPNGQREHTINYEYNSLDRYNWDLGKSVEIFDITITDEFMGDFHRQGLAKEFTMRGSITGSVTWGP